MGPVVRDGFRSLREWERETFSPWFLFKCRAAYHMTRLRAHLF